MTPVKVAFIAESFLPSINGVTNSVLRMLEYLDSESIEAMVIASDDDRPSPDRYCSDQIVRMPSFTLPWYSDLRFSLATTYRMRAVLHSFQPDIVHVASPVLLGRIGIKAARQLHLPIVALYQTNLPLYLPKYGHPKLTDIGWKYLRFLHNKASMTLAPSTATRNTLIEHGFKRVGLWGRGVDTTRFHPSRRDESLYESWRKDKRCVVGYMGRLSGEKQVEDLRILSSFEDIQLVIVGDGPLRNELATVLPHAIFTGMKTGDDLARHLASFDIFVHPGEMETFGQAIQEALASGLPVIAPAIGGPLDLIVPGENGYLYPVKDLHSLAQKVRTLADDSDQRNRFSQTARAMVEDRTWPRLCAELVDIYREVIATQERTAGHDFTS